MVVAEVVVGIVGWIRSFWGSQGVGVSGDRTWWPVGNLAAGTSWGGSLCRGVSGCESRALGIYDLRSRD